MAYDLVADGGTVHLAHVLAPEGPAKTPEGPPPDAREVLARLVPPHAASRGVRTDVHVLRGPDAASSLARLVERVRADAVVLGTRARGPLGRFLWGSVASRVAEAVDATSLLVGPAVRPVASPPAPRQVLLALELSPFESDAVGVAYALAGEGGTVHLLHAWEFAYAPRGEGEVGFPYHPRGAEKDAHEAALRKRLGQVVPEEAAARGVRTEVHVVEAGDAIDAIRSLADRLDVDRIVLGTHGRSGAERLWAGSIAEQMLRSGRSAVVVRPARPEARREEEPARRDDPATDLPGGDAARA